MGLFSTLKSFFTNTGRHLCKTLGIKPTSRDGFSQPTTSSKRTSAPLQPPTFYLEVTEDLLPTTNINSKYNATNSTMVVEDAETPHVDGVAKGADSESVTIDQEEEDEEEEMDDEIRAFITMWKPFVEIPDEKFARLLHRLKPGSSFKLIDRSVGSYNHVAIMDDGTTKLAIKVPVTGTKERWTSGHAAIMRSEADTMSYIKQQLPTFPIPTVHWHEEDFDNEIGAPFIVLSFVEGKVASDIWFNRDEDGDDDYATAKTPSLEREKLRITFLKSLAKTMAELRHLEFNAIGMMHFENGDPNKPVIGPLHGWNDLSFDESKRKYWERPAFKMAKESYHAVLDEKFSGMGDSNLEGHGMRFILDCIYNSAPFAESKKHDNDTEESFVLAHNDLDFQNIYVNDAGEIVGIIDWDNCHTVPRCVGYSSVPIWLQRDWEMRYTYPEKALHSPWLLSKYRKVYAEAMKAACGGPDTDAKYTEMSGLYRPVHLLLYGDNASAGAREQDLALKIVQEVRLLRRVVDIKNFCETCWEGNDEGEALRKLLLKEIPKVLAGETD